MVQHNLGALTLDTHLQTSAQVIAIEGPTGAGKSTLLRIMAGTLRLPAVQLRFAGECWQSESSFLQPWQRKVAWVPQDALLMPHQSVWNNLVYAKGANDKAAQRLAEELAIAHLLQRQPRHLSGGERQRVALGRALLAESRLVLLDEPFSALDHATRQSVRQVVQDWAAASGAMVILVSHHGPDVQDWAEERWLLEEGRLVARG
jgi:molybdate transport system ATP-binding protein